MRVTAFHPWLVELMADRQTVRYHCPLCGRCMEDRPEGLVLIDRGDETARHGGGSLSDSSCEVDPIVAPPLH